MTRLGKRLLLSALLLSLLLLASVYIYYHRPYDNQSREVEVEILKGETLAKIARKLADRHLIRFPECFALITRFLEKDRGLRAGQYVLHSTMSPKEILENLCQGVVTLIKVTLPEGLTVEQVSSILEREGLAGREEVLRANRDPEFLKRLGITGLSLEGYLYPDTYHFASGISCRSILEILVAQFRKVYGPEAKAKEGVSEWSVHEVVTLASIIEKETSHSEEKPTVSSVLHNRLARGMPLQCDPTVIYGIEDFDGNLKKVHLLTPGPYNTYLNKGLPPGPICNPGLDSIRAAMNPEETSYLYFVSKNNGTHFFSSGIEEHNRAVMKYQKRRRRR